MIKKTKGNSDKPDFEEVMNVVNEDLEVQQTEQDIDDRLSKLKDLNTCIDKATATLANATVELESAIRQYQRAEAELNASVTNIGKKVDTINLHVDNVIKDAPTKLQVSVRLTDADMQKIQVLFDDEHRWVIGQMQKTLRNLNDKFISERRMSVERAKEYDGTYLGHYAQWFFWFFFTVGIFAVAGIVIIIAIKVFGKL